MMEYKLLLLGLIVLVYVGLSKILSRKNILKKSLPAAFWHGIFVGICFFTVMFVIVTNLEDRRAAVSVYHIDKNHIILLLISAAAGWLWGFFSKFRKKTEELENILKQDADWAEVMFGAFLLASFAMYAFVQAFRIPSGSMRTTFKEGDHLFVNKLIYGVKIPFTKTKILNLRNIKKKDVVIFRFPDENPAQSHCGGSQYGRDFIKRVVAMPGETVEIRQGKVFVNEHPLEESSYVQYTDISRIAFPTALEVDRIKYQRMWEDKKLGFQYGELLRDNFGPVKVPKKTYFVLGDNRDHSCDSRFWGPVPEINIKGKAWFVYWPLSRLGGAD